MLTRGVLEDEAERRAWHGRPSAGSPSPRRHLRRTSAPDGRTSVLRRSDPPTPAVRDSTGTTRQEPGPDPALTAEGRRSCDVACRAYGAAQVDVAPRGCRWRDGRVILVAAPTLDPCGATRARGGRSGGAGAAAGRGARRAEGLDRGPPARPAARPARRRRARAGPRLAHRQERRPAALARPAGRRPGAGRRAGRRAVARRRRDARPQQPAHRGGAAAPGARRRPRWSASPPGWSCPAAGSTRRPSSSWRRTSTGTCAAAASRGLRRRARGRRPLRLRHARRRRDRRRPLAEHANAARRTLHHRLLGDAAEAALELGWARDAVDFARRLRERRPRAPSGPAACSCSGTPRWARSRTPWPSSSASARCWPRSWASTRRRRPGPPTSRSCSRCPTTPGAAAPFVGRASELRWLSTVLDDVRSAPGPTPVVVLSGPDGSGRHRLATTAVRGRRAWRGSTSRAGRSPCSRRPRGRAAAALLWRPDPVADARAAAPPGCPARSRSQGPVVLRRAAALRRVSCRPSTRCCARTRCARCSCSRCCTTTSRRWRSRSCPARRCRACSRSCTRRTGGLPGRVLQVLEEWRSSGRLTATSRGLALAPRGGDQEQDPSGRRALARALPRLEGDALEALQLSRPARPGRHPGAARPAARRAGAVDDAAAPRVAPPPRSSSSSTSACCATPPRARSGATPCCATPCARGCARR